MMTLLKLRRGNYSVIEAHIPDGAETVGVAIKNLVLPDQCILAAIIRRGEMVVPRGNTILEASDEVLAITDAEGAQQLAELFSV
jgi:trk system potassium uptake protein TrkA